MAKPSAVGISHQVNAGKNSVSIPAKQIADGQWTIPTTIDEEKAANPFLRADVPTVAAAVGLAGKPAAEVFAEIRARKNKF